VLRQVGVIGPQGEPTELWAALRSKDRAAFGAGIKKYYADLFATYPDADRKDDEALIAFVRSKTNYAEGPQRLAVRTFKVFVEFGDFDSTVPPVPDKPDSTEVPDQDRQPKPRRERSSSAQAEPAPLALTVNLQLQLPPSADGEVYDKLFAAMAKHLKGLVRPG
jgi:hypothetical protein